MVMCSSCKRTYNLQFSPIKDLLLLDIYMIKDQDLLTDTVAMLSHYGHTYQYLIDLLQAQTWEQFYPLLVEIGKMDRFHNRQEELSNSQGGNAEYLLTAKLVKFDKWASIDFQQVIPSLKYLRKSINYTLPYSVIHNKIPNLIDVCLLLFSENCEMRTQFFTSNKDIFTNPECNKQSFHYQHYQKMNDDQKSLFEIVAIACQSKIAGKNFDKSKKEEVIKKYVGTQSPKHFQYLLSIDSDSNDEIKAEVLNLKLEKDENEWKLAGECRVNKKCLTSTNLNKCLASYKYSYKYLVDKLFAEGEEGIFFKFNVLQLIPRPAQEQTVFNCLLKEDEKMDELREYCKKILETALHLIEAVSSSKPFFYYKDGSVIAIEQEDHEKILFFCLKMLSYPFRTYHRKINQENVQIDVELEQIRAPLLAFMKRYESQGSIISPTAYNNLCQIFIWIDESQKNVKVLQALFSKEENAGDDKFNLHYGKLMNKYLQQNKQKQLPYHVGIWFLKYFVKKTNTKKLLKEQYDEFCLEMYRFLAKSNKYIKIEQYEMDEFNYQSGHKKNYYDMIELLLKNNPELVGIGISQWMKELQYFQQSKNTLERSRTYRLAFLAIVFNCQHFPVTEEIKERLRKVILSHDYNKISFKKYKGIWTTLATKAELHLVQLIQTNLEQLLKITQDHQILSKHYATRFFRSYVSEEAQQFVRKWCLLNSLLYMNTTPLPEQVVVNLVKLFLRFNIIQLKNMEFGQIFSSQQTIQILQRLQKLKNASFHSDIFFRYQDSTSLLKEHLANGKMSMPINNAIIIQLGTYLNYIQQNHKNPHTTYELLYQLTNFIRLRSCNQQCELFLQFYNYNKKEIIQLLESLFQNYAFKFDSSNDPKNQNDVIQYSLRLKKEGKNVLEEREKLSISHLQVKIKDFICQLFANQSWEYTILVNNTKYDKVNNIKLFEKSIQHDFTKRLFKTYTPQKLPFFHRLYYIIDNTYHRRSSQDLMCGKSTFDFALPQETITIFTKTQELSAYYQTYTELIKESFKHYQKYEDSKMFEQFYNSLISSFDEEEKTKLNKQLLKQLIKQLELVLSSADLTWEVSEKIHACINVMLESYEQPIGQSLTKQLIEAYVCHIVKQVKSESFKDKQTKVFLKFLERLIPHSKPEIADEAFHNYTVTVLSACTELLKSIKVSEIETEIISLITKVIRFDNPFFNNQIVGIMKNVEPMKDKFSQLICEIMEKDLRMASIELELKCFFLKLCENNNGNWEKAKIKISDFIPIFSKKHRFHKKEFIKVVETLTKKESVKQENKKINYLRLSSIENIQYSIYLKCRFMDFQFNGIYKAILASYLENINKDPKIFNMKVRQLRIIMFNYPILVSYILMHPITEGQTTMPLIDYLFQRVTTQDCEEEGYDFFAYAAFDLCHIINFKGRTIFFSQYLCYRLACKAAEIQLTNRNIIFIFFMAKLRKFADYCFMKVKDGKSLYEMLWQRLKSTRQQFTFKENANIILYLTIGMLSRWNVNKEIMSFCDYRRKDTDWNCLSGFTNHCLCPWKGLVLKAEYELLQLLESKSDFEKSIEIFQGLQHLFSKFYTNISEKGLQNALYFEAKIQIKPEHLKHIGSISKSHSQDYFDIQSVINTSYDQLHRSIIQPILVYFLQYPDQQNNYRRKRRRMKDNSYTLYGDLQGQQSDNDNQDNDNEALNDEVNTNRQSRFAPEEFVRVNSGADEDEDSDFDEQLEKKFNKLQEEEHIDKVSQQKGEDREEEFTHQMLNLMSKINETLTVLQRAPLTIEDIHGKTLEEKYEFLKTRDLETDFDYKESTMGIQEFQNYCLSNVNKLERLGSERRNIVRNIQDTMLLKFVQRSVSSDSVDYIIDTIDENYQLLPNTLQHKNSVGAMQEIIKNTQPKRSKCIKSSQLPAAIFEDLTDEQLYEVILSYYYRCDIFPISNYFLPFLENKRTQEKVINTLLHIYHHPFDNILFPDKLYSYDLQKSQWVAEEKPEENLKQIHENITQTFMNCIKQSFCEHDDYLNQQIGRKGIKDIVFEPSHQIEQNGETYRPIYQIIQLCLESQIKNIKEDEEYECDNVFNLFRGLKQVKDTQLDNLLIILSRIHALSILKSQNQGENIDSDELNSRMTSDKGYQLPKNLGEILKIQKVKQAIRSKFPIDDPERDPFFVSLFIDTGIYSREQIMKLNRTLIEKDQAKSSNIYFINQAFKLYRQEEIKQCIEIKNSKKVIPALVKTLQRKLKLKEQPFYKICAFPEMLSLEFKAQVLYRKVKEYKNYFRYHGSEEVVAQRKKGIFQSAFLDLRNKPDGFWYEDFSVKFMNVDNVLQSGYGRGVAKDWYAYVTKGMANLNYGIFMKTSKNYYFFNRESWINPRHLQFLQFIGKLFAISIINKEMYVAPSFSILLYKMIVGEKIEIADIVKEFDQGQVITNIEKLREYQDDILFCETFVYEDKRLISNKNLQILKRKRSMDAIESNLKENNLYLLQEAVEMKTEETEQDPSGMKEQERLEFEEQAPKMIKILKIGESIELIPGGAEIPVTMENREQFITLTKEKIYNTIINGVQQQFNAFMIGFKRVVKPDFIKNITAEELRELAQGCDKIQIEDLKKNVTLGRGMDKNAQLEWFWSSLVKLSARDRMYLVQHWTGLPKISAQGFKGTNLTIVKGNYNGRLFAQTCFNKLHMPEFQNQEKMEEAIRMAINSVKIGQSIIED